MSSVSLQSKLQQNPEILSVDINGETVMLTPSLSEYIKIDPVGGAIWQRLAQPVIVADLVNDLVNVYRGEREVIQADILGFLEEFKQKGLLVEAP